MRTGQATYIDDESSTLGSEPEQSFTAAIKRAVKICFDDVLPLIDAEFADRAKDADVGIVDQHIGRAELGVDEPEQLANIFMIFNIGSFALDFTDGFCRREFGDGLIDGFLALAANHHIGAFFKQHPGDGFSYSASAACY